jgi:3-oxoadipate enol-lactonase
VADVVSDGCRLHYSIEGEPDGTPLLLAHSLGASAAMWDAQVAALADRHRIVRYDARGHGRSDVPRGDYSIEQLGRDALAVLSAAAPGASADVCGISLGGQTAMWLGLHAPDRVRRLVLANTGARIGTASGWEERMQQVRDSGMRAIVDGVIERSFTAGYRARAPEVVARFRELVLGTAVDGYLGCSAAIRELDLREEVRRLAAPTLVVAGAHDPSTPPADGALLCQRIAGARLIMLDAAHLSPIECAAGFTDAVSRFLPEH